MPDVIQIKHELLNRILNGCPIGIVYLSPPGNARPHQVPEMVKRNYLFIVFDTLDPLCTGTDKTHLPPQHIPQLRQLIQPGNP